MFLYTQALIFMSLVVLSKNQIKTFCANYEFPGVTGRRITTPEDTILNITFTITNDCLVYGISNFTTIVKTPAKEPHLCELRYSKGICESVEKTCQCENSGINQLATRVDRKDTGNWTWTTTTATYLDSISLAIVVTYPPSLTSLTFPSPVEQNSPVTIVCAWDNGNLPNNSAPELFDRHGNRFSGITLPTDTRVKYIIESVQCDDAGKITCKNNSGGSLSKTLLVRCGPSFPNVTNPSVYNVVSGKDLLLEFSVRSYSNVIRVCKFKRGTVPSKLCRNDELTGSPPDLMLHASFPDVSLLDSGLQTLTLINDVGSGQVNFFLNVTESEADSSNFDQTLFRILLTGALSGIVVVIIFRIIVKRRQRLFSRCRRHGSHGDRPIQMQRYPNRSLPRHQRGQPLANRRSTETTSSSHTYQSVSDDDELSTVFGSHLSVANTEEESTEEDDYLHPAASSVETSERNDHSL